MKLALVYDRVNKFGGAERVLLALHEIWPQAPLFTAVYNSKTAKWADTFRIQTSFLQKIPFAKTHHELFPTLMTKAFHSFNFEKFDVVLSVTSAEAKNLNIPKKTLHLCYCLTSTRYLWSHKNFYESQGFSGKILKILGPLMRIKDFDSAQKVNHFLAISQTVQKRIKKFYRRDSQVIYPPVNTNISNSSTTYNQKPNTYYLIVSRLASYKKIDIAIKAFNKLKKKLVVIGKGRQLSYLKKIARPNISFLPHLTDSDIISYYTQCRAFIFTSNEDFGIAPLEAQAYGKPVIAFDKGGATETIISKKTGIFFDSQTPESLIKGIQKFEALKFDPEICRQNAKKFDKKIFQQKIKNFVYNSFLEYKIKNLNLNPSS